MEKSNTPSAIRKRKWRLENPERYLKSNRERQWMLWNMNIDEANRLRDSIKICELCGRDDVPLVVDHNHTSGKIRGMLCNPCNSGLGFLKDNPELLRKAADYVETR